jgi:hypothetical protein
LLPDTRIYGANTNCLMGAAGTTPHLGKVGKAARLLLPQPANTTCLQDASTHSQLPEGPQMGSSSPATAAAGQKGRRRQRPPPKACHCAHGHVCTLSQLMHVSAAHVPPQASYPLSYDVYAHAPHAGCSDGQSSHPCPAHSPHPSALPYAPTRNALFARALRHTLQ